MRRAGQRLFTSFVSSMRRAGHRLFTSCVSSMRRAGQQLFTSCVSSMRRAGQQLFTSFVFSMRRAGHRLFTSCVSSMRRAGQRLFTSCVSSMRRAGHRLFHAAGVQSDSSNEVFICFPRNLPGTLFITNNNCTLFMRRIVLMYSMTLNMLVQVAKSNSIFILSLIFPSNQQKK